MWPPLAIAHAAKTGERREEILGGLERTLLEGAEAIAIDAHSPVLSEVFRWVRNQNCMAFVIVGNSTPDAEVMLARKIGRARAHHLVRVIAPDLEGLRRIRQLDAKIHLGLQLDGRKPSMREAKALGAEVLLLPGKGIAPAFIRRAHRAAMLVVPCAMDSPLQMRRAILAGVDGIITRDPAKLAQSIAGLPKKAPQRPAPAH